MSRRAGRRIKRNRVTWLWVALVLLILVLVFLFLSPEWSGGNIHQDLPGATCPETSPACPLAPNPR